MVTYDRRASNMDLSKRQAAGVCPWCRKPMDYGVGCSIERLEVNGVKKNRIPFGDEPHGRNREECPDCRVERGQFHHEGCDWEVCPFDGKQLLSCPYDRGHEPEPARPVYY